MKRQKIDMTKSHLITRSQYDQFIDNYHIHYTDERDRVFFGRAQLSSLIADPEVAGLRYYYGNREKSVSNLLLVAVNDAGNDMVAMQDTSRLLLSLANPPCDISGNVVADTSSHETTVAAAADLTARFRANRRRREPKGGFFRRKAIEAILAQSDCVGIWCFFGANEEGYRVICLAGCDRKGQEMLDGMLAEMSDWCPPFCSQANFLNSSMTRVRTSIESRQDEPLLTVAA